MLSKTPQPNGLPEIVYFGEDLNPVPNGLPEIIMNHEEIIQEENPEASNFYQQLTELYRSQGHSISNLNQTGLDRYSSSQWEKTKWELATNSLGHQPDKYPFVKLEHKFITKPVTITPWHHFPGGQPVEHYTINLQLLREILAKGKNRAVKEKHDQEREERQLAVHQKRQEKLRQLSEEFGSDLKQIPGLVEHLLKTEHPDSNIFVKIHPEHNLAIVIKEHQWWTKGQGRTGKEAIVGIFYQNHFFHQIYQFRDQFNPACDEPWFWFTRAELIEINPEKVTLRCYPRSDINQPKNIIIPLKKEDETKRKKVRRNKICTCDHPFGVCICDDD